MSEYHDIQTIMKRMKHDDWYDTFLCKDNMSVGVLRLRPGENDPQDPHLNDEIYYIINGNGYLRVNDKDIEVKEGRVIFVPARIKHNFHSNNKEIIALYVFPGEDRDITE